MRRLSGSLGLLLLAGSFSPRPASAQEAVSPTPSVQLTLASALERARSQAPSVLAAASQTAVAKARREDAGVSLLPTLSASAGLNAGANKTSRSIDNGGVAGAPTELDAESLNTGAEASLTARWLLWDFGRAAASEEALAAALQAASSDEQTAQRSAVLLVANAYLAVLADQEAVASATQTLEQRTRQHDIARRRVAAQVAAPIEEVRASIAVESARGELSRAAGALRRDKAQLAGAMGLPATAELELERFEVKPVAVTADEAAALASASRPEVASAKQRLLTAELQVAIAGANHRPSLLLSGSVGPSWSATDAPSSQTSAGANAALVFSLPLIDPSVGAAERVAIAQRSSAGAALEQVRQAVATEAVTAVLDAEQARVSLSIAEQTAKLAAANLVQAEGRYAAGAAPLMELLDAQLQDSLARQTLVSQRYQAGRAQFSVIGAIGELGRLFDMAAGG
jgi:multidrug efflux system outer membrane protein